MKFLKKLLNLFQPKPAPPTSTSDDTEELGVWPYAVFVVGHNYGGWFAAVTRPEEPRTRIGLPGGKVEPLEPPVAAAIREAAEVGWDVGITDLMPIQKKLIDGKMVWWYAAKWVRMRRNYAEEGRLIPILVTAKQLRDSLMGNESIDYERVMLLKK